MRQVWLDQVDSTNEEARRRALEGETGPVWIAARRQTAGRGRRGRAWTSDSGNLFATGLFTLDKTPAEAAQLSFAAALAAASVCDAALGDPSRTRLKWPNDVLVDGRKACGLLLESGQRLVPGNNRGIWLAVGVGINLASAPEDVERPATHLGASLHPDAALETLSAAFQTHLARWLEAGFDPIRNAWLARAHGLGDPCEARLDGETVRGVFADLGHDGALRLDLAGGGRRYISAGEVFFPDPA